LFLHRDPYVESLGADDVSMCRYIKELADRINSIEGKLEIQGRLARRLSTDEMWTTQADETVAH
jgi:hypothetical protein